MRFHIVALVAALLTGAAAVHHRGRHGHGKAHHHMEHHAKKLHVKHQHHAKHKVESHHAGTYAHMQHTLNKMVEHTTAAEVQLGDASRCLEEALLDIALVPSANATAPTLRGAPKQLPGNLSAALKAQETNLGNLFSHLKLNIGNFNKREADQKKDAVVYAERLEKRLKEDQKKLKDPKLSDFDKEMLVNRTRTEEHELKFWNRGRELQHDMFHSNLKLTHGLMSRVKTVMDAYKQVLASGKLDPKLSKVLHETSASLPKALIQKERQVEHDVAKLTKHAKISAKLLHRA